MALPYDRAKSDRNLRERGYDFDYALRIFEGLFFEFVDGRKDYGERRMIAIGKVDGRLLKVVYTPRDGVRHVISSNPASRQEKRLWQTFETQEPH